MSPDSTLRRQQPRHRSVFEFLSVSRQLVLSSSPPNSGFYRGGNYSDAGGLDLSVKRYADDLTLLYPETRLTEEAAHEALDLEGYTVLLVDDVLYTGRTIRAALEALLDYGRPMAVELLALIDRGHRELPIHADYVGRTVNTSRHERVDVLLAERDGQDAVHLTASPV